jgi:hypothetical protein
MIMKYRFLVSVLVVLNSTCVLAQEEYPQTGIVYNIKEDSSITYSCVKKTETLLECDLVQTAVRRKANASDLNKKLAEAKKQMPNAIKEISKDNTCEWVGPIVQVLRGKITPEQAADSTLKNLIADRNVFIKSMNALSDSAKQETLETMSATDDFCKTKSEDSYLKITKLEHERQMRTCTVGSNPFKQRLIWVTDYAGTGAWVVSGQPSGPCGVVQLDRFEPVKVFGNLVLWRYIAKKVITNPKGELLLPGMTCADFDQDEYPYSWKKERDSRLGCEYIEFTPY